MTRIRKSLSSKAVNVSSADEMHQFVNRELRPLVSEVRDRWNGFTHDSVGELKALSGVVPEGYLLCDGATYPSSSWPELWASYRDTGYPFGGDASTFVVPTISDLSTGCSWYVYAGANG